MHLFLFPYMPHASPIMFFLIWSPEWCLVSSHHKAPRCVVFSTPLSPRPSYAQISSSVPCSRILLGRVIPWTSEIKFHTHCLRNKSVRKYMIYLCHYRRWRSVLFATHGFWDRFPPDVSPYTHTRIQAKIHVLGKFWRERRRETCQGVQGDCFSWPSMVISGVRLDTTFGSTD